MEEDNKELPPVYMKRGGKYRESAKTLIPYRRRTSTKNAHPVDEAGLFATCFFSWLAPLIWKFYKTRPTMGDLWSISLLDGSETNYERFNKLWQEELKNKGKEGASLKKVGLKFIRTRIVMSFVCVCLLTLCQFVSNGIIVRWLMAYVTIQTYPLKLGIILVLSMLAFELTRALLFSFHFALNYRSGLRLRSGLLFALFRKVMRTPPSRNISVGEILSMCSNDGDRLFEACHVGLMFTTGPVMFICGTVYLCVLIGSVGIIGSITFVVLFPLQGFVAKRLSTIREGLMKLTDKRVKRITEILTSIKLIKMYSWEESFRKALLNTRHEEQKYLYRATLLQSTLFCSAVMSPMLITTLVILVATKVGIPITPTDGFTLMSVINLMAFAIKLSPISIRAIAEAFKALERFQIILTENDFDEYVEILSDESEYAIEINDATFHWHDLSLEQGDNEHKEVLHESKDLLQNHEPNQGNTNVCLDKISLKVKKNSIVGICGNVGAGKSSLFSAILGQLRKQDGTVKIQGLTAYCSQSAWIMNATIRENIIFGEGYNPKQYNKVVKDCCLLPDFETFKSGDLTEVGERGINLSGGQKQRISLARAVYRNSDIYLLDDPLSAVDAHVGKSLFNDVIQNLLQSRTVLLITHQLQYLPKCDVSVYMADGKITEIGTHEELMEARNQYYNLYMKSEQSHEQMIDDIEIKEDIQVDATVPDEEDISVIQDDIKLEEGAIIGKESSNQRMSSFQAYCKYVSAGGGILWYFPMALVSLLFAACIQFNAAWLTYCFTKISNYDNSQYTNETTLTSLNTTANTEVTTAGIEFGEVTLLDYPEIDFFMLVFGLGILIMFVLSIIRSLIQTHFAIRAANILHNKLFEKVLRGTMAFFDTTPTGRIINRFQKDQDIVDTNIPLLHDIILMVSSLLFIALIYIAYVYPWILLLTLLIIPLLGVIVYILIEAVRETRRLDNVSRSPWLSHIITSSSGVATIRSYGRSGDFIDEFARLLDTNSKPYYLLFCFMRWILTRMDFITIANVVACCLLIVLLRGVVPPAYAGLALTSALLMSGYFQFTMKCIFEMDSFLIAVDRIVEYIDIIPVEDASGVEVISEWPENGKLELVDVEMRYRPKLPLALKGVTFTIEPRECVGVVGRTGSGKSSLAVCLYRLVEICGGKILVDGVDTSKVELKRLRSIFSVIPQDPTLFFGTIKYNLDPFDDYSEEEMWKALENVHLKNVIEGLDGKLDAIVLDGGTSLSMGERQLLCLARAILRKSKVVILDEATASIDSETDSLLQSTLRSHFSNSSLIIIAHRLHTVSDCDKVVVMDNGKVSEFGDPKELIKNKDSLFSKLIQASMDMDS